MYRSFARPGTSLRCNNYLNQSTRRILAAHFTQTGVQTHFRANSTLVTTKETSSPSKTTPPTPTEPITSSTRPVALEYDGPLTGAYKRLKVFSLTSLGLASMITPFMFIIEGTMSTGGRAFLGITAMTTSTISTALIAWAGSSYVTRLKIDEGETAGTGKNLRLQFTTTNIFLKSFTTTVYDPMFLEAHEHYFTKVQLKKQVRIPMKDVERLQMGLMDGLEETVAETMDSRGKVKGWWAVKWRREGDAGFVGECSPSGKFIRGFNISPEVLRRYLKN